MQKLDETDLVIFLEQSAQELAAIVAELCRATARHFYAENRHLVCSSYQQTFNQLSGSVSVAMFSLNKLCMI